MKDTSIRKGKLVTIVATFHGDRSWIGDVLKVTGVNLPFISADNLTKGYNKLVIDTRNCNLMGARKSFAQGATRVMGAIKA